MHAAYFILCQVVHPENGEEELWILTDRFHLVMVDKLNKHEVNFRILKVKISELTRGSKCGAPSKPISFPEKPAYNKPNRRPGYGVFNN